VGASSASRLRMTVSPLRPRTWPQRLAFRLEERAGLPFLGGPGVAALSESTNQLPLELLPEVARLDLQSEEAILAFVTSFGTLGAWRERFELMRTADFGVQNNRQIRRLIEAREQSAMAGTDPNGEFVDEFRVAAAGLYSLLLIVLEMEQSRFSVSRLAGEWPQHSPWPPPESKTRAWWALFDRVNQGLSAAPIAIWWVRNGEPTEGWSEDFEPGPPFVLHPATPRDLYGVCILEVADHVTEDNPYRVCANETCNRLFSVQDGRSRYGAHRTDNLRFHTPSCKDAQTQRVYRRRQAAERRKGKPK
jgi:hypothetical protein